MKWEKRDFLGVDLKTFQPLLPSVITEVKLHVFFVGVARSGLKQALIFYHLKTMYQALCKYFKHVGNCVETVLTPQLVIESYVRRDSSL